MPISLNLILDEELLKQIEDYRFSRRLPSRLEAIRELLRKGLGAQAGPSKGKAEGSK
jgi:metal-responsive CopG/Arc/MetJ family transcriptional regulator